MICLLTPFNVYFTLFGVLNVYITVCFGDTASKSEGRSAAVAERTEDIDSDAENHAHSHWFSDVRFRAQHLSRSHQHSRVDRRNGKARTSTCRWLGRCRRGVGSTRKLGDARISARAHSSNDFSLFFYGNPELAFIFIFCICKYSPVTICKTLKLILQKKFNSHND